MCMFFPHLTEYLNLRKRNHQRSCWFVTSRNLVFLIISKDKSGWERRCNHGIRHSLECPYNNIPIRGVITTAVFFSIMGLLIPNCTNSFFFFFSVGCPELHPTNPPTRGRGEQVSLILRKLHRVAELEIKPKPLTLMRATRSPEQPVGGSGLGLIHSLFLFFGVTNCSHSNKLKPAKTGCMPLQGTMAAKHFPQLRLTMWHDTE